jgi:ribose 5-phosphate isomerase B
MAPKRGFFSLNIDSQAEHYDQHITEHHPDGTDSIKVIETKGPTHGHTDFSTITKPFERTVNRVVDDVVKDTGKKVERVDGDVRYTSQTSTSSSSTSSSNSNLNVKNKSTRRYLERRYDTSDL